MDIAGHTPRTGGDCVLLVEDEASISEPFSHALAREGFEPEAISIIDSQTGAQVYP
jgi:hypothetical protein